MSINMYTDSNVLYETISFLVVLLYTPRPLLLLDSSLSLLELFFEDVLCSLSFDDDFELDDFELPSLE